MSTRETFIVIQTINEHDGELEVCVVPDNWLLEGQLLWPTSKKPSQLARKRMKPTEKWTKYDYKVLRDEIATYDEATKVMNSLYADYSDSDAADAAQKVKDYLRKHPTQRLRGYYTDLPDCNQAFENFSQRNQTNPVDGQGQNISSDGIVVLANKNQPTNKEPAVGLNNSTTITVMDDLDILGTEFYDQIEEQPVISVVKKFDHKGSPNPISCAFIGSEASSEPISSNIHIEEYIETNWREVTQKNQKDISDKFDRLERKMNMLLESIQALAARININETNVIKKNALITVPDLPLRDPEDVVRLNFKLVDPLFLDQMIFTIKKFEKVGNTNTKVRSIMEGLMTYKLAVMYTWTGKVKLNEVATPKYSFCDKHGLISLVCKCLQYRNLAPVIEKDVIDALHDFFKRSKGRCPKV